VGISRLTVAALLAMLIVVQPAHSAILSANPPLSIGLGFSQATVEPVSSRMPVYTVGDQLWFRTYTAEPVNVTLTPAAAGTAESPLLFRDVPGNSSESLFTFSNADAEGSWTLTASTASQGIQVEFYFVNGGAPVTLSGYDLKQDGTLALNYTLDSSSAYDLSACTTGTQSVSTVYAPVPAALGGGTLLLALDGSSVSVIPEGTSSSFTLSLSLSQEYAYEVNSSIAVSSTNEEVVSTEPVPVAAGLSGSFSTALVDELPMRTGEFTLSASFESTQGTSVYDTPVLVTGTGSWVWLQDCSGAGNTLSDSVTVSSSLQEGPSFWPRDVYLLYQEYGVGLFSVAPVTAQPAVVDVLASQWGTSLTDSEIEVSGAPQYAVGNGTIYLAATQYPLQLTVTVPQSAPQQVSVTQAYSVSEVQIPANQVVVKTLSGGAPASGVVVVVQDANHTVAMESSVDGEAVFYIPPGDYTVVGTFGGTNVSSDLSMKTPTGGGQSVQVTLQFAEGDMTLSYLLLSALAAGIVLTGAVWVTVYRRLHQKN
jgi:hypothetical protein